MTCKACKRQYTGKTADGIIELCWNNHRASNSKQLKWVKKLNEKLCMNIFSKTIAMALKMLTSVWLVRRTLPTFRVGYYWTKTLKIISAFQLNIVETYWNIFSPVLLVHNIIKSMDLWLNNHYCIVTFHIFAF